MKTKNDKRWVEYAYARGVVVEAEFNTAEMTNASDGRLQIW